VTDRTQSSDAAEMKTNRSAAIFWIIVTVVTVTVGSQMGPVSAVALTGGDGFRLIEGVIPECNTQTVEQNDEGDDDDDDDEPEFYAPSNAEMVLRAKVVLYGRITRRYDEPQRYGPEGYTAEMDIYCTLKGVRSQRLVNISFAGK